MSGGTGIGITYKTFKERSSAPATPSSTYNRLYFKSTGLYYVGSDGTEIHVAGTGLDALLYKGVINCSANPNYPAADAGHIYFVSVAGKIGGASGTNVVAGDMLVCNTDGTAAGDQATVGSKWNILEKNVDFSNVTITGGTINGATIGATTPAAGAFTTLKATTGAAAGLILQSDASGNLTYTDPAAAANAGLSSMVNPKAMSQGVSMTYAASGSSGITVADNDNIDFGTGNFTLVWKGSLPDWTPSASVILITKDDAVNTGWQYYIKTDGMIGFWMRNGNKFGSSTCTTGVVDGTTHELAVTVEPATGTFTHYLDGVKLGDTVVSGALTDCSTTAPLYILGQSSTARTAGTVHHAYTFNRALTAAEVLDLYRNGIAFADKWGSNTELITAQNDRDFSSETIGNWTLASDDTTATVAYNVGPAAEKCAKFTAGATLGTYRVALLATSKIATLLPNKKYRASVDIYVPVGHGITSLSISQSSIAGSTTVVENAFSVSTVGVWQRISSIIALADDVTGSLAINLLTSTPSSYLYFDNVSINEVGATLALESEGIQPAPGQWLDSSSNNLHALQPATGSTLTRSKKDFEYRWTNTWTASSAAQYIGGLNQAVLSADHFITDIITQATVTTDVKNLELGDGSAVAKFVAAFAPSATRTSQTIAAQNDGTNLKLVYTPAGEATMTVETIIRGFIWEP